MRKVLLFSVLALLAGCSKKEVSEIAVKPKMISRQISLRLIGYDKSIHKGFIVDKNGGLSAEKVTHVLPQNFRRINGQVENLKARTASSKLKG